MKIGILGTGAIGETIASKLAGLVHEIMVGMRDVWFQLVGEKE